MPLIALVLFATAAMYAQPGSDQPAPSSSSDGRPGPGKPQAKGCDTIRPMAATAVGSHPNATPVCSRRDGQVSTHGNAPGNTRSAPTRANENDESSLIDANTGGSPENSPAQ